jgi:hypothetical protein
MTAAKGNNKRLIESDAEDSNSESESPGVAKLKKRSPKIKSKSITKKMKTTHMAVKSPALESLSEGTKESPSGRLLPSRQAKVVASKQLKMTNEFKASEMGDSSDEDDDYSNNSESTEDLSSEESDFRSNKRHIKKAKIIQPKIETVKNSNKKNVKRTKTMEGMIHLLSFFQP